MAIYNRTLSIRRKHKNIENRFMHRNKGHGKSEAAPKFTGRLGFLKIYVGLRAWGLGEMNCFSASAK
jgi:hypothetical protein